MLKNVEKYLWLVINCSIENEYAYKVPIRGLLQHSYGYQLGLGQLYSLDLKSQI